MKKRIHIDVHGIVDQKYRQDYWLEVIPRISIDIGYGIQIGWLFWGISFYIEEVFNDVDEYIKNFDCTNLTVDTRED